MTRAWVEIDLGALCRNGAAIAAKAGAPILPMLLGDANGIGALRAALALDSLDPWGFGVSNVADGEELRRGGITRPVVVFTPILRNEIDAIRRANLRPALGDPGVIESWGRTGLPWHLQIDSGLSFTGMPWSEVRDHRALLERYPPEGVFTDMGVGTLTSDSIALHEERFGIGLGHLPRKPTVIHTPWRGSQAGSPSTTVYRTDATLYGVEEAGYHTASPLPVISVRARIVELRNAAHDETPVDGKDVGTTVLRRISTVPVGYSDGYRFPSGETGFGLYRGRRVPVVGRVSQDTMMLDVTGTSAGLGDVVTLLGFDGGDAIAASDFTAENQRSVQQFLSGLALRLPRRYLSTDGSEAAA